VILQMDVFTKQLLLTVTITTNVLLMDVTLS
jgi:hypothetical protein